MQQTNNILKKEHKMRILSHLTTAVLASGLISSIVFNGNLKAADEKPAAAVKPKVTIKSVPNIPPGDGATDDIEGTVQGVNPSEHKVVIYAYGDKWYVQPTAASPLSDIEDDGKWEAKTHGGLEYAVLLVKPSFKPPATCEALPKVGGDVLALAKMKPKK